MKKMRNGSIVCEVSVTDNYNFISEVECEYEKDVIAYAVERFFAHSPRFRRECSYESWQLRTEKGKARKTHKFTYCIPAPLMEVPGEWVRLSGEINPIGVKVNRVELLKEYPISY